MGETLAQRIEMAFALRELGVDSIPINILNPIEVDAAVPQQTVVRRRCPGQHCAVPLHQSDGICVLPAAVTSFQIQEKALCAGVSAALVGDYLTTLGRALNRTRRCSSVLAGTPKIKR